MDDETAVYAECQSAQADGREISDGTARTIASWWHGGQYTDGYSFASTGNIGDSPESLWRELGGDEYGQQGPTMRLALDMLGTYLLNREHRGPVEGWSNKWVGRD